jgi:hypothetical protein
MLFERVDTIDAPAGFWSGVGVGLGVGLIIVGIAC